MGMPESEVLKVYPDLSRERNCLYDPFESISPEGSGMRLIFRYGKERVGKYESEVFSERSSQLDENRRVDLIEI